MANEAFNGSILALGSTCGFASHQPVFDCSSQGYLGNGHETFGSDDLTVFGIGENREYPGKRVVCTSPPRSGRTGD